MKTKFKLLTSIIMMFFSYFAFGQENNFRKNDFEIQLNSLSYNNFSKGFKLNTNYSRYLTNKFAIRGYVGITRSVYSEELKKYFFEKGNYLLKDNQINYGFGVKYHFKSAEKGFYSFANIKSQGNINEMGRFLKYELGLGYRIPIGSRFNLNFEIGMEKYHKKNHTNINLIGIGAGFRF